jgi:hypothetical protein
MKTKFVLASVFAALSGLAGFNSTANAGTDVHLSINLGTPRRPVIVVPSRGHDGPGYGYSDRDSDYRGRGAPRGYWKEIVIKTWVPGRWVVSCDYRGRTVRSFHPGHHAVRTDRVWVSYDNGRGNGGHHRRG